MSSSTEEFSRPCPKNGNYDVFLSFRGTDTRYGFTTNLYRSLQDNRMYTFMDVKLTGEDIDYLFEMIGKSRLAVVIYSERFASSDWCLRELEMIMQRRKEKKMLMIPIFYKVDVHELKRLTGKTGECLDEHVTQHGETSVQKWKNAVTNLGKVSGLSYKDSQGRSEYDFITDVITKVKEKLRESDEESQESSNNVTPDSKDIQTQDNLMERPIVKVQVRIKEWECVMSIDVHPTRPWVLLTSISSDMIIWNYETRVEEKSFRNTGYISSFAKFVPEKHWILLGDDNGVFRVFDYNTWEKQTEFQAHKGGIRCMEVHPTLPYVLTASDDKLIGLWNWEDDWACWGAFEGHKFSVKQVAFNPKDPTSFASVSLDGTIKIWSLFPSDCKFTLNGYFNEFSCVEYFVGNDDKLYILSGSDDCSVKIWDDDCSVKTPVQTLKGHTQKISTTLVHPELPIILTGSEDKTVHIWKRNTHQLLLVWNSDLGEVLSFGYIKASKEVVIGCKNGMVVVKFAFVGYRSA